MKKSILILVLMYAVFRINAQSNWFYNQNLIYANPITTKVGIGTTIPGAELHILDNGTGNNWNQLTLQSSSSSGGLTLINNLGTIWEIQNAASVGSNPNGIVFYNRTAGLYALSIASGGNVGIGTTSPSQKLEIYGGNMVIGGAYKKFLFHTQYYSSTSNFIGIAPWNNGGWDFNNGFALFDNGKMTQNISQDGIIAFNIHRTSDNYDVFRVYSDGKVYATEITVTTPGLFPDYVFDSNYDLRSLKEIETFIKINKHLPDMPTAKYIEDNGINLGELQVILVKKIEELTLYLIQQQQQLDKQNTLIIEQQKLIENLYKR